MSEKNPAQPNDHQHPTAEASTEYPSVEGPKVALPADSAAWIGKTISHYRIVAKLGSGGMGVVYRAIDEMLDRPVAIKFLPAASAADAGHRRRFLNEAKAASALNHPNIITIHEVGSEDGVDYIVMECVDGATLSARMESGALPLSEQLQIGVQIASALGAAHRKGILHRDLKPANIMVTASGLVKVLDFGLAKSNLPVGDATGTSNMESSLTLPGSIIGTPSYMSPEQAQCEALDSRADIFSFGVLLYEMAAGQRPFVGANSLAILTAVLTKAPEPLRRVKPEVPEELEAIVTACLQKELEKRAPNIELVCGALEEIQSGFRTGMLSSRQGVSSLSQLTGKSGVFANGALAPNPAQLASSRLAKVFVGATAALALLGGGWFWSNRGNWSSRVDAPSVLNRLTADSGLTAYPAISSDGRLLAYASDRAGQGSLDLWLRQFGSSESLQLTSDEADEYEADFSKDGSNLAFRSEKNGGGIYTISALGGKARMLAAEGHRPKHSPDGSKIAYWQGFIGPNFLPQSTKIFVIPSAGGEPTQVGGSFAAVRNPIWLPDGKRLLAIARLDAKDSIDWYVFDLESGKATRTGAFAAFAKQKLVAPALEFAIVPDGYDPARRTVHFSAASGDSTNIWAIPFDLKNAVVEGVPSQITSGTGLELHAFQPNLPNPPTAFTTLSLNVDIWSMPMNLNKAQPTGPLSRITQGLSFDGWPSLSADGRHLAYATYASGRESGAGVVMVRDLETGKETSLTPPLQGELVPNISPDAKQVLYSDGTKRFTYLVSTAGGAPAKLCENCVLTTGWFPDNQHVFVEPGSNANFPALLNISSRARVDAFIRTTGENLMVHSSHVSSDGRWVSFHVRRSPTERQIYVAPVQAGRSPSQSEWIPITDGKQMDREAVWSPDGNMLYFLSDRDGFRCIWAQTLEPATKKPKGAAFVVQHFHHTRQSLSAVGRNVGAIGLTAAKNKLVFGLGEVTGNVWLRETKTR